MHEEHMLSDVIDLGPHLAAQKPMCAVCGEAEATNAVNGTLEDGTEAGFVPVCKACLAKLTKGE